MEALRIAHAQWPGEFDGEQADHRAIAADRQADPPTASADTPIAAAPTGDPRRRVSARGRQARRADLWLTGEHGSRAVPPNLPPGDPLRPRTSPPRLSRPATPVPGHSRFVAMHRSRPPRSSHTLGRNGGSTARWPAAARHAALTPTTTPPGATPPNRSIRDHAPDSYRQVAGGSSRKPLVALGLPFAAPEQPSGQGSICRASGIRSRCTVTPYGSPRR